MLNNYSILLFNAASYNPFFTILGLLLGAVALGLGYGAVKIFRRTSGSQEAAGRVAGFISGLVLLGGAIFVLGLAAICAMWVAG
jgi:cytochrome c oxidase assembly factor CtaG